jgi:hypothetical protein
MPYMDNYLGTQYKAGYRRSGVPVRYIVLCLGGRHTYSSDKILYLTDPTERL